MTLLHAGRFAAAAISILLCVAPQARAAHEGGFILKARYVWSRLDGSTVLGCYRCASELGLRKGPTLLLIRRVARRA